MSTEEENNIVETEQPVTPPQETAETTAAPEPEVNWNDVPDPEDETADNNQPDTPPDTGTPDPASSPSSPSGPSSPSESAESAADPEDDDPYSFLDDLDNPAPSGQDTPPAPAPEPAPASSPSSPSGPSSPSETPAAPLTLDTLNFDDVVSGLPDDLKEFAENYPDESRMAAEMARQMLKKLGFDQLQADVKKYSGAAEQFGRSQQEIQAKAAQDAFEQAVMKVHPDVKDIIIGKEQRAFASWLKAQPKFLQQRFRDTRDPEEACDILTRYKSSRDGQTRAQQRRASKFSGVRSATSAPRVRSNDGEVGWNDIKDEDVPEY